MADNESVQRPRVLVLCFDGSLNKYKGGSKNTNVVRLFAMLRKDLENEQLCYYQPGIGTYVPESFWSPLTRPMARLADIAVAWYLEEHVMGGYRFLMDNYQIGDKICLFGFGRGAYTARALAGMLTKVGLLPKDKVEQVPFVWKLCTKTDATSLVECRAVDIAFLGVWDTVASTGVFLDKNLPFATKSDRVRRFRHALALDERRANFEPTFWHSDVREPPHQANSTACDVKEVWFVGGHSDVGGGANNNQKRSLADISLRWMVREVLASNCGIQFDSELMDLFNVHPLMAQSSDEQPQLSERDKDSDSKNALEPIHDWLNESPLWWVLEVIPLIFPRQDGSRIRREKYGFHLGRGRYSNHSDPLLFHETVRIRMEMTGYRPGLNYEPGTGRYVW